MPTTEDTDRNAGPDAINELLGRRGGVEREQEQAALVATGTAARAAGALREALDEVHVADDAAWAVYAEAVHDAMEHAETGLGVALAQLRAERATSTDDLGHAVELVGRLVRRRVDTLRVRAHRARMDAASTTSSASAELEEVVDRLSQTQRSVLDEASASLGDLRRRTVEAVNYAMGALRRSAAGIGGRGASSPPTPPYDRAEEVREEPDMTA